MKLAKFGILSAVTVYGGLYYFFPLLRGDSSELFSAGIRLLRISSAATIIGYNYAWGITSENHSKNSKILFEALKSNGGCYVKCGQVISLLDLVVPQEYSETMKPMLNQAPISDILTVREVVEKDLSGKMDEMFLEFDEKPLASASLAQVHKARLKSGEYVAVKVQHKWIKEQYPGDIRVLEIIVNIAKTLFKDFDYGWIIEDLKKSSIQELNFLEEARNAIRCYNIFKDDPFIKIPKIYQNYSSERVLTMELMDGVKITDIEEIKEMGLSLKDVAFTLSRAFNEMIFVHGFIHCDPHPGNIFVKPVKVGFSKKAQIIILDHGLYRELSKNQLESYKNMWKSIILQDEEGMKKHAAELGVYSMYPLLAGMMVGRPWDDIMDTSVGLDRLRNARAYTEEKEALKSHAMRWHSEINQVLARMDNEIVLIFKTFEWLRSNDAKLGAPINTIQIIADYVTKNSSFFSRLWIKIKVFLYKFLVSLW